jgi:hypothetical protein
MGGLLAAEELGLLTQGYMPKGFRTELGYQPEIAKRFMLDESEEWDYQGRTKENVELADATVIFGRRSPGSNATEEFCRVLEKPMLWVVLTGIVQIGQCGPGIKRFRLWLEENEVVLLNVAGNRESRNPGIQEAVRKFLVEALA